MDSQFKGKGKPVLNVRSHEELGITAIAAVPIPTPVETGNLAEIAGKEAEREVNKLTNLGGQTEEIAEAALNIASQNTENAVALDSRAMAELTKESLTDKVNSLEVALEKMKSGEKYSKLPQEIKERVENVAWLASQAGNRLDSMEGPGQENVLRKASEDVSFATFAMSTVPLEKQDPASGMAKFHKKLKELREMGIEERVGREREGYIELRAAAIVASLEIRVRSNARGIALAKEYRKQNKKSYSKEENKKIRGYLALAAQLNGKAQKSLQGGKLLEADALISKSNALSSATMMYLGAVGSRNSMRPPIRRKNEYERLRTAAASEISKIEGAMNAIAALDTSMDVKELSAKTLEKFGEVQEACGAVQKKAAEAELLRFDASREGYVDKRLERVGKRTRGLIDAGQYEDATELLGVAFLYKGTYEKSSYKGIVGEDEKKKTLGQKQKELAKKFGYSPKRDNLRQARRKLGRALDALCPPEKEVKGKRMGEAYYERELAAAKGLIKSVKKGLTHAQDARQDQKDQLLVLGKGQKKKPGSVATNTDIDLMAAYGLMGRANDAEQVLDTTFQDHLDAERELYIASLNVGETMGLLATQDKLVTQKQKELAAAGKDLAKQSAGILGNVALKESFEEIEEREKEEGIIITPHGETGADRTALAVNGRLTGTLDNVMKQEARMSGLHDATVKILGGKTEETGVVGYNVAEIVDLQKEELKRSDEVLKEAGGMQAIGRSASTYLMAYRAGESRFWGNTRTVQMRDYIPRAMDKLYDAAKHVGDGKWKDASKRYGEAQGQFMEGFATASERKYNDPLIVEYKEKTQNAFDVLIGVNEGEAKDLKAAILALNATNLTVQTQYRGSQVFEGGLENIFVSFEDGGWLTLLGPAGMVAAQVYRASSKRKEVVPKTREEKLERIGYVPYEKRVARMEAKTEEVLSGKTSLFEKRGALNSIRNDADDSLETYQIAQSAEDGLFTAASLALQPIFITEMTRDTVRHGADVNTAILAAALATGKIGQFRKAASEFAEVVGKGAEQLEKLSKLQKVAQHLKDPVELVHFAATGYLVVHGTAGAVTEFEYFAATGDTRHLTAGVQSIAFQIPILTGFTAPMLRGGKTAPRAREKSLLGRVRDQRLAEQKFRERLEKSRTPEQRELEQKLKERPEAPTGEKVKETIAERKRLIKAEEKEWEELKTERKGVTPKEIAEQFRKIESSAKEIAGNRELTAEDQTHFAEGRKAEAAELRERAETLKLEAVRIKSELGEKATIDIMKRVDRLNKTAGALEKSAKIIDAQSRKKVAVKVKGVVPKIIVTETVSAKLRQNLEILEVKKEVRAAAEKKIGASALEERTNAIMRTFKGMEEVGREVVEKNPELFTQPQAKFEANVKRLRQTRKDVQKIKLVMEERGLKVPEGIERDARPYLDVNFRENVHLEVWRMEAEKLGVTVGPKAQPAAEKAAPAEAREVEYSTRRERQDASFMKKYGVEWAEKTIAENRPEANETVENQRLRYLAFNRIAREPAKVRMVLKERTIENTPKELRGIVEIEWKIYVEGMIPGLNEYSPVREMSRFKAIQSEKLAPKIKSDVDGFVRNAEGANAHGVAHDKGGHERFTNVVLKGEIPQTAWVGPMKKGPGVDRSTSSAFHGPFWVVLEGKAGAKKGPISAKEHVAYVCPSEKYMVETSRAIKDAYSQGLMTRTEAVKAISKLMTAAEAKEAPATAFRSRAGRKAGAREFWAERSALAEGEIVSFERFSRMEVKEVAAKPKKNIVEKIKELRAEEKRTGRPSLDRAMLERQIEQNPHLKKAVEEYRRMVRLSVRAEKGTQFGMVGDVEGFKAENVREAGAAKAKAGENLVDAEATAKPAEPSVGMTRARKALKAMKGARQRAKERILALARLPAKIKRLRKQRRKEKRAQVLTPKGERVKVPQEQAENASKRMQDTIFKSAITDTGMRNAIGLERGRSLAKNAWAEVYRGEAKPTFKTTLEKDTYVAMKKQVQARFEQVVDYAWKDTIREKTHLRKRTKKPARVADAEIVVYLRMKKVFGTIWEANVKRKGMNRKAVKGMVRPQELAAEYMGYLQRGAGMPKEMLAKVKEMGIETTFPHDGKFVTTVKNPSGKTVFGDLHGDHTCPVTTLKEVGFVIDARPDLAVGDTSISPKDRYILNKEIAQGTQFIFLGDYIDRGPHSLYAVDFVQWLKAEVKTLENGSRVHTLKGNHEAIFTRIFNIYRNKSTAEVKGLIHEIDALHTAEKDGNLIKKHALRENGQIGELRKEGILIERVGTEKLLGEILDRYGTWEKAVVEMKKEGGLMHFIENTTGAVILENENGNSLYTHGGIVAKTAARETDGTIIRKTDGEILYDEIRSAEDFEKHFKYFFKNDLNWVQNGVPTESKAEKEFLRNMRERGYSGDYSIRYAGVPETDGGGLPRSATSKAGKNLTLFADNLGLMEIGVGHHPSGQIRQIYSQEIGNGKNVVMVGYDAALSSAYGPGFSNWQGGQAGHSTAWGLPGERNKIVTAGRENVPGVRTHSTITSPKFTIPDMKNPYTKAWEQTEGKKNAAVPPLPTAGVVPAAPKRAPAPKKTKGPKIMPKRPNQPVNKSQSGQNAPINLVKKAHPKMPENIEKWVDPETGLPWSKLKEHMNNENYSKKFTLPVEINGKETEWTIKIEGTTQIIGEEMYWYTISSWPANINYPPGQNTGAVIMQKGASLKNLIIKNIKRDLTQTGSGKKSGAKPPGPRK